MQRGKHLLAMAAVLGIGYLLGSSQILRLPNVLAQDKGGPSDETVKKIQTAYDALRAAQDALKQEGLHKPVTKGLNSYAVLAGGLDCEKDLEEGKGVDPETFAALYAGDAVESIEPDLSRDEDGRLTYKNKVVRIYPISRLKKIHDMRGHLTGEAATTPKK
jgi:hypothetical protein